MITNFFSRVDGPLPIRWTPSAEPPKKKPKRGPGRPRKQAPTVIEISDPSDLSEHSDGGDCTSSDGDMEEATEIDVEKKEAIKRVYTVRQKRQIAAYAKNNSVSGASQHYHVPRTTINRWMKDGYFERETTKKGTKKGAGRPVTYGIDKDEQLLVWLLEARDKQLPITTQVLKAKARELICPDQPQFKASDGWVQKFKQRHKLVLRMKTSLAQELPATLEERITAFCTQLRRLKEINNFEMIGNMDETPLYFDIVPNHVLDRKGKKSIIVRTTGSEKRHLTIVLCVTHEGEVLPALAIFKGKRPLKIKAQDVFIRTQQKAWMDEEMMLEWIDLVWEPATEGKRALLVLDSFSAHITNDVKKRLKEINTVPLVIPGGCTSKIQPLDVCLNKPFKSFARKHWSEYVMAQAEQVTTTKKLNPPQKQDVANWVSDAVHKLQDQSGMVIKSFATCGITGGSQLSTADHEQSQQCLDTDDEIDSDNPFADELESFDYEL